MPSHQLQSLSVQNLHNFAIALPQTHSLSNTTQDMPRSPRVSPRAMIPQGEWRTSAAGCPGTYDPRFAVMAVPSHADLMQYYGMSHAQIDTVVPQVRPADAKPTKGGRMSGSARVRAFVFTGRRACVTGRARDGGEPRRPRQQLRRPRAKQSRKGAKRTGPGSKLRGRRLQHRGHRLQRGLKISESEGAFSR